jgi:hypothetical protein
MDEKVGERRRGKGAVVVRITEATARVPSQTDVLPGLIGGEGGVWGQ